MVQQCLRKPEALTHTKRVFCYFVVCARFKTHQLYKLVNAFARNIVVHTAVKLKIFASRKVSVHFGVFNDTANAGHCRFKIGLYVVPANAYFSAFYTEESEH